MNDLVSILRGIEAGIWAIWFTLVCILLFKDCNGHYYMNQIKNELNNLANILKIKLNK